jgi:2-polyprenyl-3-methyl-5-hydroxy-6-metoxy-1,4-benzoquinol methylase
MQKLKQFLQSYDASRILDIGTGAGNFVHLLLSVAGKNTHITGIDTSKKAIERAKATMTDKRVDFQVMDVHDMTLDAGIYDIVCLSNSIHHMEDFDGCVAEMKRMAKEDGVLLFNEMRADNEDEQSMTHTLMHHFWASADRLNGVEHRETMTKATIHNLLSSQSGLTIHDTWTIDYGEEQELTEDDYKMLHGTFDSTLKRVEDKPEYDVIVAQAKILRRRLDEVGFKSAEQIISILTKDYN